MKTKVTLNLNGNQVSGTVENRTLLVDFLRNDCGKTGTHIGCDTSQCGACVVHVNGKSVKSCTILAIQAQNAKVLTIEGVAPDEDQLHPMQDAFRTHHGLQCGFCTSGMIMSALELVERIPDPTDRQIADWLEGNLCRCTGYLNIVKAVKAGAEAMRSQAPRSEQNRQ